MATTAGDIITAAFIKVGVGVPTTAQTASALISLNNMMSFLGVEIDPYCVTSESYALTSGDGEYTIGSGGNFNTARPIRVLSCYLRDGDNYDYPVKVRSDAEYNNLFIKSSSGRPTELYYLPEYPLGKIKFDCLPDYAYTAYFQFIDNFTEFTATTTSVTLPPEYKEALVYNLAVSLGEDWDRTVSKSVYAQAVRTREVIDRINAAARVIPKARFDLYGMGSTTDYSYHINTDDTIDGGAF